MSYLYAQGTCKGFDGSSYTVSIIHDVAGTDLDTTFSLDASGFVLEYGGENDMYLVPGIMHSTCTINMLFQSDEFTALNTMLSDIVNADDGEFLLRIDRSSTCQWLGVILPEQLRITEESALRELRIKATDGLSLLKTVDYNNAGTTYTTGQTVYDILQELQEKTVTYAYADSQFTTTFRLAWAEDVISTDDYTYTTHPPSTQFQGIKRALIYPSTWIRYENTGETFVSSYEVLVSLCNTFQWQMYSYLGGWFFLPIGIRATNIYGSYLAYNDTTGNFPITGEYSYQTISRQKLRDWTIGYSPTVKRCKIQRKAKESPSIFQALNFDDGTTLSSPYLDFEGQDTASDTEFIQLSGRAWIENTAVTGLSNSERVARIVLRCEIKWDDGADAEWYGNQILVDSGGAVVTWLMQTLGVNVQNDLAVVTVLDGEASSTSTYFYYHIEEDQYLYDAGVAGGRWASWGFDIPLPTTAKTGLSVTPEILIYDRNFEYDATLTAAATASWFRFSASSYASDDELRLLSDFDIVAETTTGRAEIDLGYTYVGQLAGETGRISTQVSIGIYGSSEAWVNTSSSSARQINKLLVEEVLALNKKSAYVERGTIAIQSGLIPAPISRYYDDDTGRYYTALTWSWNAGESLLDLTLRNIGRNFEFITSDEQGGTRNPFIDDVVHNQATKPGNVMHSYNAEAEAIFDAWTSGTVIGAGKTLEAYYTVCLNGNGKYVDFQGNTPGSGNTIERVIYVKSDGLADHTSTSGWTSPSALQPTASTSLGPTIAECWVAINAYLTKFNGSQNNFTFLISHDIIIPNALLLDDYPGAAAAYSLRKLDKDYTGDAVRVRRASDNTEQDIGFDSNGDLDTSALATFCSGTNGFVKTWYDQSGNSNDATQTTTTNQPKIYDSSTGVVTENGKPAVTYTSGTGVMLQSANFASALSQPTTWFAVGASNNTGGEFMFSGGNASSDSQAFGTRTTTFQINAGIQINTTTSMDANQHVWSIVFNGASSNAWQDGSQVVTNQNAGSNGITRMTIFNLAFSPTLPWEKTIQEIILYGSNETSNQAGIETNINDYYSIY
jgi:hypothetical protein